MSENRITERFLRYVSFPTMSDESSDTVPSTEKQLVLGRAIAEELRRLGLDEVVLDDKGYLYATLPSNIGEDGTVIGLIAHMDTSDACPDYPINARIVHYDGGDVCLNEERGIYLCEREYPSLARYVGDDLIVTDGTTLLGADDKAGICAIISAIENIMNSDAKHGKIRICFTPDEEIGRGANHFDVKGFGADYAYTVDGGALGEIEYENFNAAAAKIEIRGISIHPGSAKDKMKNALLVGMDFNSLLPQDEIPAKTEGYEGFFHLTDMSGECERATLSYIIRDHDADRFARRKAQMRKAAERINEKYGEGTCTLTVTDSYFNMKTVIEKHMYTVERAAEAMRKVGVTPIIVPIRGGTDGARLSFMGLPCPNICTGGENFHSRFEYVSVQSLEGVVKIVEQIIKDSATFGGN